VQGIDESAQVEVEALVGQVPASVANSVSRLILAVSSIVSVSIKVFITHESAASPEQLHGAVVDGLDVGVEITDGPIHKHYFRFFCSLRRRGSCGLTRPERPSPRTSSMRPLHS
jgi:hypothetical protein